MKGFCEFSFGNGEPILIAVDAIATMHEMRSSKPESKGEKRVRIRTIDGDAWVVNHTLAEVKRRIKSSLGNE